MKIPDLTIVDQIRCNKCILPNCGNLIKFDEHGTCQICNSSKQFEITSQDIQDHENKIDDSLAKIKKLGIGRNYDCVVGLSGGRDSTFLLYQLVKKHNIRCLAAYYRTPFTSDVIDANVKRTVAKLGVPLVEMDISREYHKKITKKMFLLWKKKHSSIIANLACAPCKFVNREIYKIAVANNVRAIVYGTNLYEAVQIAQSVSRRPIADPGTVNVQRRLWLKFTKTISLVKKGLGLLAVSAGMWKYIMLGIKSSIMYISPHTFFLSLRYPKIYPMNYFYKTKWNEIQCKKVLDELGWELPKGCNTTWRADCSFAEFKNYMFYKTIGTTYTDAFFSNMIRAGIITRREALSRLKTEGKISEHRFREVCDILELPNDTFEQCDKK